MHRRPKNKKVGCEGENMKLKYNWSKEQPPRDTEQIRAAVDRITDPVKEKDFLRVLESLKDD